MQQIKKEGYNNLPILTAIFILAWILYLTHNVHWLWIFISGGFLLDGLLGKMGQERRSATRIWLFIFIMCFWFGAKLWTHEVIPLHQGYSPLMNPALQDTIQLTEMLCLTQKPDNPEYGELVHGYLNYCHGNCEGKCSPVTNYTLTLLEKDETGTQHPTQNLSVDTNGRY